MRVSLHAADLSYAGGLGLHTASSGAISHLAELYLKLDDGTHVAVGETRTNIAYLNGLTRDAVIDDAVAAVAALDLTADPRDLLADLDRLLAGCLAPVRMLVDMALHDLAARRAGVPLCDFLAPGAKAGAVSHPTNQTLFWSPFETFRAQAAAYVARGFRDLKVRIAAGPFEDDLARIGALRAAFGDTVKIAADANGMWGEDEAIDRLKRLSIFDLAYVEQPVAPGDWAAIARVAEASPIPLMLDESLASEADIARLVAFGGRIYGHLKLVKLGGLAPTFAAARRLSAAGVPFMIGQMNEGGVSTAAALHLCRAAGPDFAELYGADGLMADPADGLVYADGNLRVAARPGLGIHFDPSKTHTIREF
ncbi:mandelate racemase/muconate lactonizing enzyme family protein [Methylobrevis pamukkalensis]|uniref:L-Ala-D/L-Glu epimerase n=1 Tax=Methylobrevis pamukkalensis TaxID=1439726 RepID=A0A1E3H847_9HYPH|nr:mandelate racemase/muconate lactonizing enzyme family protein [Methylobrevis pamukkalensis]ODN72502.1 L-Ala-D/L-Glu epimerase [Methylobrevis pamukkalensis]